MCCCGVSEGCDVLMNTIWTTYILSILRSLILILLPDIQFSTSFHIHLKSSRFHHLSSVVFISIREAAACRCLAVFSLCLVRTSDQQSESDVLKASCLPLLKWHWASGQKKKHTVDKTICCLWNAWSCWWNCWGASPEGSVCPSSSLL